MSNQDIQELVVYLSLNKYAIDGWQVNICTKDAWETYNKQSASHKMLFECQADISSHKEWLCQASVAYAEKLKKQAAEEYNQEIQSVKEFESKFMMLAAPISQPTMAEFLSDEELDSNEGVSPFNMMYDDEEEVEDAVITEERDCPHFDMGRGEDYPRD